MPARRKTHKIPGFMRSILADNVKRVMEHHYRDSPNKPMALAKDSGLAFSTVQRILAARVGASLDNIEAIAAPLQLSTYQLLVPNLNVTNPAIVTGATKEEEKLYRAWKRAGLAAPDVR